MGKIHHFHPLVLHVDNFFEKFPFYVNYTIFYKTQEEAQSAADKLNAQWGYEKVEVYSHAKWFGIKATKKDGTTVDSLGLFNEWKITSDWLSFDASSNSFNIQAPSSVSTDKTKIETSNGCAN